jgi:hypothetical protein
VVAVDQRLEHLPVAGVDAVEANLESIKLAAQGLDLGVRHFPVKP